MFIVPLQDWSPRRGLTFVSGSSRTRLIKALTHTIFHSVLTKSIRPSAPWRSQHLVRSAVIVGFEEAKIVGILEIAGERKP